MGTPSLPPVSRLAPILLLALVLAGTAHAQHAVAFPNPIAGGPLTVRHDAGEAAFELFDVLGRRLDTRAELAAGVYLWRLRLADGSATAAQRLTMLVPGPLDVRLVREAAPAARAMADAGADAGAGARAATSACRRSSPVFGGVQHRATRGAEIVVGEALEVTRTARYAAAETCLGAVKGVGLHFPPAASPFSLNFERFQAEFRVASDAASSEPAPFPVTLRTVRAGTADLSMGLDASVPRLVQVLDLDADGRATVVASAVIPAGTPVNRRLARLSAPGGFELASLTASTWATAGDTVLDSVASVRLDFRTAAPEGVTFRLDGETVHGDAVVVTIPGDAWIIIESVQILTTADGYQVDDIGFLSSGSACPTVLHGSACPAVTPAWLRTADPNGLYSTSTATTEVQIGCARGQSCAGYGVRSVSDFLSSGSGSPTVFHALPGQALPGVPPTASAFHIGGLTTGQGRGLLSKTGDQFETSAIYIQEVPSGATTAGRASVVLGTPVGRSLVVRYEDTGSTPTVTGGEVRYLRDGVVRRQETLTEGVPVDMSLRVEVADAFIAFGTEGSTLVWRFADGRREGGEVEVRLTLAAPPASSLTYQEVTFTFSRPWTLGFVSNGSANPTVLTAPE